MPKSSRPIRGRTKIVTRLKPMATPNSRKPLLRLLRDKRAEMPETRMKRVEIKGWRGLKKPNKKLPTSSLKILLIKKKV
jgi:hypothetical protein